MKIKHGLSRDAWIKKHFGGPFVALYLMLMTTLSACETGCRLL